MLQQYIKNLEWKLDSKINKDISRYNLMGHYTNYILFGGYSPTKLYKTTQDNNLTTNPRHKNEAQFQVSIKVPVFNNIFNSQGDLFLAYTQNSYWQIYDKDDSSPFRETNYQPELFWQVDKINKNKFGLKTLRFGAIHQSNGQAALASRSWNRTELHMLLEANNFFYGFNIWSRWDEPYKADSNSTRDDDNPLLTDYIGNQKVFVGFKYKRFENTLTYQNDIADFEAGKGSVTLDIALPSTNNNFNFFFRYFYGYGESLIDFDKKIKRYSVGVMVANPFWDKKY
jgi:phospholipase A1